MFKNKRLIAFLLRFFLSALLVAYFLYKISKQGGIGESFKEIMESLSQGNIVYLLLALSLHLVGFTLMSLRWKTLMEVQGYFPKVKTLFVFNLMAAFFNNFLPSTIGGDTIKAIESRKLTDNKGVDSTLSVLIDRICGVFGLFSVAGLSLLYKVLKNGVENKVTLWIFLAVMFCFVAMFFLAHPKRLKFIFAFALKREGFLCKIANKIIKISGFYYLNWRAVLKAVLISVVFQLNMVLYYYLIACSLGQRGDFINYMLKIPLLIFLLMVVPAINGLGIRTLGFRSLMGFSVSLAMGGELLDLSMRLFYGIIGGIVYIFYKRKD